VTNEEWEKLKPYAARKASAEMALNAWRYSNMPTEPREQMESRMTGERLHAEFFIADNELTKARERLVATPAPPDEASATPRPHHPAPFPRFAPFEGTGTCLGGTGT
jgi:hypothetical protein